VVALALVLLLTCTGVALTLATTSFVNSGRIAQNVYLEGLPVGGQTSAEAVATLQREWVPKLPKELELRYPGGSLQVPPDKLGAAPKLDVAAAKAYRVGREGGLLQRVRTQIWLRRQPVHLEVECAVNGQALDAALAEAAGKVNREPRDAEVEVSDDDEVTVKPHVVGVVLDLEKSRALLLKALTELDATSVDLVVNEEQPKIKAEDLAAIDTVLASYHTHFNSGLVGRTRNIRLATRAINKRAVLPGDVFSVNEIVGERSPERGFERAPIFWEGGELREDYGGGLCQVASTIFNAALRANLQIVERSQHTRMVTYVPLGLDAMVIYGSSDLRWRNNLEHSVVVVGDVSGETLTFKIIGSKSDQAEVKIERANVGTIGPPEKEIKDLNLEEGKRVLDKPGWSGGHATAWRMTKVNGKWERTWYDASSYSAGANVYRVGAKKKEGELPGQTQPGEPRVPHLPAETEGGRGPANG